MKNKFRIMTLFCIFIFCIGGVMRGIENDTFYMIKLGESIVHHGIDGMDHFSFISGLTYTYPHWLYDVFLYFIYDGFGYMGIYISNIVLFLLLILSIYSIHLHYVKNEFLCSFVSILSIFLLNSFVTARSQLVSMILFIWEVYFILRLLDTGKKRYSLGLLFISFLLANVHGTIWPMYFILYLPFIFENIVVYFRDKFHNVSFKRVRVSVSGTVKKIFVCKFPYFRNLMFTFFVSLFMGIFSPSRICYSYVFRIMSGDSLSYISEHAPLVLLDYPGFLVILLLFLVILIFTNTKIRLSSFCMILGLSFMAFSSVRHLSLFYLIALLFIGRLCSDYINLSGERSLDILICYFCKRIVSIIVMVFLFLVGVLCFIKNSQSDFVNKSEYPVDAVSYIKNNINVNNLIIFNNYNFGSYLLFCDIPVFIDSRSDLYMDEFNNLEYDILDDYMYIVFNYEEKFEYYNINYVLDYVDSELSLILYRDSNYEVVYEDKNFVLFHKLS